MGKMMAEFREFAVRGNVVDVMVRFVNRRRRRQKDAATPPVDPATRQCPRCISEVPKAASRCAYCTSELEPMIEPQAT